MTGSSVVDRIADLLRQAAEAHHDAFRSTGGADDDWASWYADWLGRSELPAALGAPPQRRDLVGLLVELDGDHRATDIGEPWERWYATRIVERLGAAGPRDAAP